MVYLTAARAVEALVKIGVLTELTGKKRGRLFAYERYLRILNEGQDA